VGPFFARSGPVTGGVKRKSDRRYRAVASQLQHRLRAAPPLEIEEGSHHAERTTHRGQSSLMSGIRHAVAAPVMASAAARSPP